MVDIFIMILKLITVDNGSNEYPGNFAKKEQQIISRYCRNKYSVHLFSGRSNIGDIRVDFSQKEATHNMDVFTFLQTVKIKRKVDVVVLDPPYCSEFANKYQKIGNTPDQFIIFSHSKRTTTLFKLIDRILKPKTIIIKSWNYYVPKGYINIDSYICYAGGYRKSTILMICKKPCKDLLEL